MSTFKGFVAEFPEIRSSSPMCCQNYDADLLQVDYFRKLDGRDNPLACFLSHVHSDHLQGLESYRTCILYYSFSTL